MKDPGFVLPTTDEDGKQYVVAKPGRFNWDSFFTSKDDDAGPPIVRGGGSNQIRFSWADTEDGIKSVFLAFAEPIELGDGRAYYTGLTMDDELGVTVEIPANSPSVNGSNEGNCNLVDAGAFNIIVPAAGDGTHDIVLVDAIPVKSIDKTGYYKVNKKTGAISEGTAGESRWNLIDATMTVKIMVAISMGNPLGVMDIDPRAAAWMHQTWKLKVAVVRVSTSGAAEFAGWFMLYRQKTY